MTLTFFQKHIKPHKSPLCAKLHSHDRRFLIKHILKAYHFHYRHIDVSSFKEVIREWNKNPLSLKKEFQPIGRWTTSKNR